MRGRRGKWLAIVGTAALALGACSSSHSSGTPSTTVAPTPPRVAPHPSIGVAAAADAYVWGSPLVITERTLQTFAHLLGVNRIFSQSALSTPASRTVVAPNVDTLYSIAVVDLRDGPVVLHVPQIASNYWTYQFVDAWTDSFAYIGTRATHGQGGTWLIAPPSWHGTVPAGATRITSPTPQMFLLGRWFVEAPAAVAPLAAALHAVTLQPLSPSQATPVIPAPRGTPQTVAAAGAGFFDELGDALAVNPPATASDQRALARLRALGIGPGLHPASTATAARRAVLAAGVAAGFRRIELLARDNSGTTNGWAIRLDIGTYTDALTRAVVAQVGWGANIPAEAVYARSTFDSTDAPYDGSHTYRLHFAASQLPPVSAFWSLTLYGPDQFLVPNSIDRYAISTRTPGFRRNADGSVDIWISHTPPPSGTSNWLPAPAGRFLLTMRMYLPGPSVLSGDYVLPAVQRTS